RSLKADTQPKRVCDPTTPFAASLPATALKTSRAIIFFLYIQQLIECRQLARFTLAHPMQIPL
ncbi:hypothetical protein PQQ65_34860, partial [Paraburkholderia strydomiana]|uniref:hypothetical protein n=1 Tax=Paraburkholderia strydomiana TaxID=1245417 RepID=UPI0038B70CBB